MKRVLTGKARASYLEAPPAVRKAFDKQAELLEQNLRHPSLRAKKYDETNDRWQARVNQGWRFYFKIEGDTYRISNSTQKHIIDTLQTRAELYDFLGYHAYEDKLDALFADDKMHDDKDA